MIDYISLFSGIGAFEKALQNQGIPYNLVNFCEFDKYATKSYCLIHNVPESKNLGDITKVDVESLPQVDLISYGFPCQDISLSGKQKGLFNTDGSLTRSGLFFEALKIIEHCKPKVAIAENVKNLTSKKFAEQFKIVLDSLDAAGYNNYWKVLNSKDYGIPQNRERVFIVSIRKDCDNGLFEFPEPYELKIRLKDLLEDEVDEKYFLSEKMLEKLEYARKNSKSGVVEIANLNKGGQKGGVYSTDGIVSSLTATDYKQPKQILAPYIVKQSYIQWDSSGKGYNSQQDRAYFQDGLCPTLSHCNNNGDKSQIVLCDKEEFLKEPLALDEQNEYIRKDGTVGTIMTDGSSPKHNNRVIQTDLRIRKLTPKECWRLQGFSDSDIDVCVANGLSNTQLYKQAGNSITVDVMEEIFCMLFDENGDFYI